MTALQRYAQFESSYRPRVGTDELTLHEQLAATDFMLRFVTMCAAAALRAADPNHVRLNRSPGFGGYISALTWAQQQLRAVGASNQTLNVYVLKVIQGALEAVQSGNGKHQEFGTLKKLRDHIAHGGSIPEDKDLKQAWKVRVQTAADALSAAITSFLADSDDVTGVSDEGLKHLELVWPQGNRLELWPFVCADSSDNWCVFSSYTGGTPYYIRRDNHDVRVAGRSENLIVALNEAVVPRAEDKSLPNFVGELRDDLEGFRDPDTEPYHHEVSGVVNILWIRATSDDPEERSDLFRLGEGDRREWQDNFGNWVSYPLFLRQIANWPAVARSTRQRLEKIERKLIEDEQENLDWSPGTDSMIQPFVDVTNLQGTREKSGPISFDELRQQIDDRLKVRGSQTRIFFISGEAGIGKTRTLISTALKRSLLVEVEDTADSSNDRLPLFLYVRSTGQVLSSLSTVVNDAVAYTRNLNEKSVQTLCRNGLIALFVDGFDELLGGVGYDNALGSLKPWIEALGGRGVIVVSARSSYYLNQYRSSLDQNQNLSVEHRVAEFKRWTPAQINKFIEFHSLPLSGLNSLSADDRKLLGLPFFARVYVEAVKRGNLGVSPLPDVIVDQYLTREASKLNEGSGDQRPLLNTEELRSVFENLALLMAEYGEREIPLQELQYATQMAIGDELDTRRGLANRLTVLCGIAVAGGNDTDRRFAFQHEIFFDIFLADITMSDINSAEDAVGALGRMQWRSATAARIARLAPDISRRVLTSTPVRTAAEQSEPSAAIRSNIGLLWESLLHRSDALVEATISGATFEDVDLTGIEVLRLEFAGCIFRTLTLPPAGNTWDLRFINCTISTLQIRRSNRPLQGISAFDNNTVLQILDQDSHTDKPSGIAAKLHDLGAPVEYEKQSSVYAYRTEAMDFYLSNLRLRADTLYITEKGHRPVESHAKWTGEYGPDLWSEFINTLLHTNCAALKPLSASGQKILRVKFNISIDTLRRKDQQDPRVAGFWKIVSG
ncbi:hypothetical protein [Nocardia salmonicida]|uniref:NACHT domain-containing protein n=1 Tax=Nocardia salmonicida TaxID=53431 RepID=UPI002E2C05BC|nr:hypothetical protein [Nocardia salmonicida]